MTSGKSPTLDVRIEARIEDWPIAGSLTISRGARREAVTGVAEVSQDGLTGRRECVPYPRHGETPQGRLEALKAAADALHAGGAGTSGLQAAMFPGTARNALIDLQAKRAGQRTWTILGRSGPSKVYPPDAALWG